MTTLAKALSLTEFVSSHAVPWLIFASLVLPLLHVLYSRALRQQRKKNKWGNEASGPKWKGKRSCWGVMKVMKFNYMIWREEKIKTVLPITAGLFTPCPVDKICCKNIGNDINSSLREIIRVLSWRQKEASTERASYNAQGKKRYKRQFLFYMAS